MKKSTKYSLTFLLLVSIYLGVNIIRAFSDRNTSQPMAKQLDVKEYSHEALGEIATNQETTIKETLPVEQLTVPTNSEKTIQTKAVDTISEANQKEIDRIEEQIKELDRINKEYKSNYQPPKTINFTPPKIEPIAVPKIDTTIKVQPIDGTIKSTGRPADVCASSAAKFLPECK